MVVSPHYLATAAGARILEKGGNAFDAAVAVSACLAVVYPHMTGLGGDSFWLSYHSGDGKVRAYNGSGRSGALVHRGRFAGMNAIPTRGVLSAITVPGMVDGWNAIHGEYGRLSFADVLEPAISYASNGFPMSADQHENTVKCYELLSEKPFTSAIYTPNRRIPKPGERFVQAGLAKTLTKIALNGRDAFYRGDIARDIVHFLQSNGGLLTLDDFEAHEGNWVDPLSSAYRDHTVYQLPPNSQGFVGLMILNVLEKFDFQGIEHGSAEYYHLLVEAVKICFRDRDAVLTDPEFSDIPLDRLLSKDHASKLADQIKPGGASSREAESMGSDTAYAAVMDAEGNAVSFIQSLYFEFGSGVVAGETGILLQNRGSFFSLDAKHVNCLEPRKRTFHTLMPAMACLDGKPAILYGTQGGEGQPQTQTALLTRMIDYGMDPQQAIDQPRWVWGRTWGAPTQELKLESRIDPNVIDELRALGHTVRTVNAFDGIVGHAHAIAVNRYGYRRGGADPRSDGAAMGW
ncbi:gamma-glutamyltransferase [Paenibacillus alkalitolerans]|uniref:gamma-glutamyltransferase n=1 Tax=Paenibacillus alkalitolerans TaxID=2799335 RepID=UPI0018F646E8|nr:gamma-glutamyltransferase [Paenibacillus alkalitolerans]